MPTLPGAHAEAVVELSREHGLTLYSWVGNALLVGHALGSASRETGADGASTGAGGIHAIKETVLCAALTKVCLPRLEAEGEGAEAALTRIDEALALAGETGEHWTDAFLHRIRGEILLKRDPANTAPAEEAFLTAIAIAQQQKAKSFELRAALSLAKLYQSTGRAADAHAVLAPALEGFSPTPEFPRDRRSASAS